MRHRFASRTVAVIALTAAALAGAVLARTASSVAGGPPPPPPPPLLAWEEAAKIPGAPGPEMPTSADIAALHATVASADRIVAFGRDGTAEPGSFDSSDRRDIESFDAALQITAPEDKMRDFCEGSPEVKLYRGDQLIAVITYHHGAVMRTHLWATDVFLDDPDPLIRWFSDRGIPGPQREADQAVEAERAEDAWRAAMPKSLQPFWDDMRDVDWPDYDIAPLREPLKKQYPSTGDRVRALYAWFGSSGGPWTGFAAYQEVPERLLLEYPIEDLVAVASEPDLKTEELEGAARLLAGWDFSQRRPDDLLQVPAPLKSRLRAHSMKSDDEDKRGRAEAAFAP